MTMFLLGVCQAHSPEIVEFFCCSHAKMEGRNFFEYRISSNVSGIQMTVIDKSFVDCTDVASFTCWPFWVHDMFV